MQANHDDFLKQLGDVLRSAQDDTEPEWEHISEMLAASDFDLAIKNKLEQISIPPLVGDWEAITETMDEVPFDELIKEKLQDVKIDEGPGWALLASQLGPEFDRLMADKLTNATVSESANWPVMEDQLEAPTEAIIAERLRDFELPYSAAAWKAFRPALNKALPKSGFPWLRTGAVAGIILLLSLGGSLLWNRTQTPAIEEQPIPPAPSTPKAEPASPISPSSSHDPVEARYDEPIVVHQESSSKKAYAQKAQALTIANQPILETAKEHVESVSSTKVTVEQQHAVHASFKHALTASDGADVSILSSIEKTKFKPESKIAILTKDILPKELKPGIRLGWTHTMLNTTTRFSDPGEPGYLTGLQIALPISAKVELISGLQYGKRSISRLKLNEFRPSNAQSAAARLDGDNIWQSLLKADFVVWEIPVMLRYTVTDPTSRFGLSLQGGIVGMIVQQADYQEFDPQSAQNALFERGTPYQELNPDTKSQRGVTTWGNIRIAPVLQYRISKRLTFELAPHLQLGQQRVGLEQLKLSSVGGSAGIMINFEKSKQ
ncbi:MAG: hypothetical protein AB8F95_11605 [Bacteroidia bacterium]